MHASAIGAVLLAAEDLTKPSNPILPDTNEIIYSALAFLILVVLMWKFAFPAVRNAMQARTDRIRGNLDEAERVRGEAEGILADYQRQLADARNEANRIIEEARAAAEQVRSDLVSRAEAEVAELRARNAEDLRAAQDRAVSQLQSSVRTLALDLAEKVVGANLDRERNLSLVDQYIAELDRTSAQA